MAKKFSLTRNNNRAKRKSHQANTADVNKSESRLVELEAEISGLIDKVKNRDKATGIFDKAELESYSIYDKNNNLTKLKLYDYQHWHVDRMNQDILDKIPIRDLNNKPRKCGQTTLLALCGYQLTKRGLSGCIIGTKPIDTTNAYEMVITALDRDPEYSARNMTQYIRRRGEYIELPGGGNITFATAGSNNAIEGTTKQWVLATEYAKWPGDLTEQSKSLFNTISNTNPYTFVWIDTTPRPGTDFQTRWYDAEGAWPQIAELRRRGRKEYGWRPNFIPWVKFEEYQIPFYNTSDKILFEKNLTKDEIELLAIAKEIETEMYPNGIIISMEQLKWRRTILADGSGSIEAKIAAFNTEYPLTAEMGFTYSEGKIFSAATLQQKILKAQKPIRECEVIYDLDKKEFAYDTEAEIYEKELKDYFPEIPRGEFRIWEPPQWGVQYSTGGDVAEGLTLSEYKTDSSAVHIRRNDTGKTVATWYGKIGLFAMADMTTFLGHYYNIAYTATDNVGIGKAVSEKMAIQYPLYALYHQGQGPWDEETSIIGCNTKGNNKKVMILLLAAAVESGNAECDDIDVLKEALNLEFEPNGTINTHGKDRFMAWVYSNQAVLRGKTYAIKHKEGPMTYDEMCRLNTQIRKKLLSEEREALGTPTIPSSERIFS